MTFLSTRRAFLALALASFLCLPAWPAHAQDIDLDFAAEHADGMPRNDLDADVPAIVQEILDRPAAARESIHARFGEEFVAELLRVLAGWRDAEAQRAYQRLMEWNLELFYEQSDSLQKRFVNTVVALQGPGSARVRADLALEILEVLEQGQSRAAMLAGAQFLTALLGDAEGAEMVVFLEVRAKGRIQPLIAHALIYNPVDGEEAVADMLAHRAHRVALRLRGGNFFDDDDVGRAQARYLGQTLGHVELALEDWGRTQDQGPRATAAHGAKIVRLFLSGVDALTLGVSSVVTRPIRLVVNELEEYETSREEPPEDPAAVLREQMLEAVMAPLKVVTEDLTLEEASIQVIVDEFRRHVETGRASTVKS